MALAIKLATLFFVWCLVSWVGMPTSAGVTAESSTVGNRDGCSTCLRRALPVGHEVLLVKGDAT
jgi:hypothetical protein